MWTVDHKSDAHFEKLIQSNSYSEHFLQQYPVFAQYRGSELERGLQQDKRQLGGMPGRWCCFTSFVLERDTQLQ